MIPERNTLRKIPLLNLHYSHIIAIFAITSKANSAMKNQNETQPSLPASSPVEEHHHHVCKEQILLRNVPCEVIQVITRKKIEIMTNNKHRTQVSNSEAIYKLILKGVKMEGE